MANVANFKPHPRFTYQSHKDSKQFPDLAGLCPVPLESRGSLVRAPWLTRQGNWSSAMERTSQTLYFCEEKTVRNALKQTKKPN